MDRNGQAAMEYIMTYWWAIFIVMVVGVLLYQMGVFSVQGNPTLGKSGFMALRPIDWACSSTTSELDIIVLNAAGGQITNFSMDAPAGGSCTVTTVGAGRESRCTVTYNCGEVGSRYEVDVTFSYVSKGGLSRTSIGTLWGPVG